MADLDYAFLADYAVVEGGKLTAVGASYTYIVAGPMPAAHNLVLAGRIRAPENVRSIPLTLRVEPPDGSYIVDLSAELHRDPSAQPYAGKLGFLFSLSFGMPLPVFGLYQIYLRLDGADVRRLAFEVVGQQPDVAPLSS